MDDRLVAALGLEDPTERMLEVAAVVQEALNDLGIHPVVVGGLAVAYWTKGSYLTHDIDVLMPASPRVDERMAALGFEKEGRFWTLPGSDIVFEAPGSALDPGDEQQEVELRSGRHLALVRVEDLLVHRLEQLLASPSTDTLQQAITLLKAPGLNRERLDARVAAKSLTAGLAEVEVFAEKIERGETVETFEIHEMERRIRKRRLH
jgi:hypothetical protein